MHLKIGLQPFLFCQTRIFEQLKLIISTFFAHFPSTKPGPEQFIVLGLQKPDGQ